MIQVLGGQRESQGLYKLELFGSGAQLDLAYLSRASCTADGTLLPGWNKAPENRNRTKAPSPSLVVPLFRVPTPTWAVEGGCLATFASLQGTKAHAPPSSARGAGRCGRCGERCIGGTCCSPPWRTSRSSLGLPASGTSEHARAKSIDRGEEGDLLAPVSIVGTLFGTRVF